MFIGVDIEDISRFENRTLENDLKFLERIFTSNELNYCYKQKKYAPSLTARFCAKEAVIKALSGFYDKFISYNDIEILNHSNGAPYVNMLVQDLNHVNISLSISHEKDKAIAFAVINQGDKNV